MLCICHASQDVWRNLQDQVQDSEQDAQARKMRQGLSWLGACVAMRWDSIAHDKAAESDAAGTAPRLQGRPPKHCLVCAATRRELSGWGQRRITIVKAKASGGRRRTASLQGWDACSRSSIELPPRVAVHHQQYELRR